MATPTVPLTYNAYVQTVAAMAVVQTQTVGGIVVGLNADGFDTITPQMLQYAELRIQRDVAELLPLQSSHDSYFIPQGSNLLQIPINDFIVIQDVGLVDANNAFTPLLPASKEFIQNVCGSPLVTGQPQYFSMIGGDYITAGQTYNQIAVGPYADQQYAILIFGQVRMPSLYLQATQALANSGLTYISSYLPDLLVMASLVFMSQFQHNFSPTSNDPEMPASYEAQYQTLLAGVKGEEFRKRFEGSAWSAQATSPVATTGR